MIYEKLLLISCLLCSEILGKAVFNPEVWYVGKDRRTIDVRDDSTYHVMNVGRIPVKFRFSVGNQHTEVYSIYPDELLAVSLSRSRDVTVVLRTLDGYGDIPGYVFLAGANVGYDEYDTSSRNDIDSIDIDSNGLIKTIVSHCASFIPVVGDTLSTVISFFWPASEEPSAWEQVEDQVIGYVDDKAKKIVKGILGGDLASLQEKIETFSEEMEEPEYQGKMDKYFMNTADTMVGFEKKFIFRVKDDPDADDANYYLLPMFTDVVNLKLLFYQYGFINQDKIGLEDHQIRRLKTFIRRTVGDEDKGAIGHVTKVFNTQFINEYINGYSTTLYNRIVTVRTYCAINGFQHFPNWNALVKDPTNETKPENPYIAYSTIFGRWNAKQIALIVQDKIPPPLQPAIIDGKLNLPTSIDVYLYTKIDVPSISSMTITYENGDSVRTGVNSKSGAFVTINFNNSKLMNLTAHGDGQIDGLEFRFDDGRTQMLGHKAGPERTFSLEAHHIVGIFMTGSALIDNYVAANIVVSYQLIVNN